MTEMRSGYSCTALHIGIPDKYNDLERKLDLAGGNYVPFYFRDTFETMTARSLLLIGGAVQVENMLHA